MNEIIRLPLREIKARLDRREISAYELTKFYIDRIGQKDQLINSYITLCAESAVNAAKKAQESINKREGGLLCGLPLSVKDNICTCGIRTTCASKMLENYVPPYDATAVERIKRAGAVILGKTNMDEFAMGSSSQTSYFGGVKNPYDTSRISGGSSGGSAAAVAASLCCASLGSDTGGSVRQPAALCGVTGLKPTYGAVSRWGLVAFASSLDQIGILARSALDASYVFDVICGCDSNDMTSSPNSAYAHTSKNGDTRGIRIGIPREFFQSASDDAINEAVLSAASYYEREGFSLVSVSMPSLKYALQSYYIISSAEAASNLSRYDGIRYGIRAGGGSYDEIVSNTRAEGFGDEVKRRIMLGNYALCEGYFDDYYVKAAQIRSRIKAEYDDIFKSCDVILTPTAPHTARKIGNCAIKPSKMYGEDIFTVPASLAGLPSVSTVCGYDANGMPIGMSITGRAFDEETILSVCSHFERDFKRMEAML